MLIVMFQVGQHVHPVQPPAQQYLSLQQAADISPPLQQYLTVQQAPNISPPDQHQYLPLPTAPQWPQGYPGFQQDQQQQIEQVCFIQLCFVIVYIVC